MPTASPRTLPVVWLHRVLSLVKNFLFPSANDKYRLFGPKPWIIVVVGSLLINFVRTGSRVDFTSILSRNGFPVQLTHSFEGASMLVAEGKSFLDVIKTCPSLYGDKARYISTWWLRSGNLQTMWNTLGDHTKTDVIPYDRIYLRLQDNGTLVLDTYPPFESTVDDTPIVLILHGITGNSQGSYARATVNQLTKPKEEGGPGFRAIVLNFRGCDGTPVTSPRLYHAGETDDTRSVLLYLTQTYPRAPIYAVGFSMGANTLAVYLGEQKEDTPIKAAILVSNPWDWVSAANYIENGHFMNRFVYGPVLADALRNIFAANLHAFPPHSNETIPFDVNVSEVLAKKYFTIRWYDDRVTSKLFGFVDGEDYYVKTSSQPWLERGAIRIPTLALHSLDDPILHPDNIPWDVVRRSMNKAVVFAATQGGGHVGWFEDGHGGLLRRWYTKPIVEIISAIQEISPDPKPAPPATYITDSNDESRIRMVIQSNIPAGRHVGFVPNFTSEEFRDVKKRGTLEF